MKVLYGTTNQGKLQAMKCAVNSLNIELIGLNDLDSELPYINENGNTPLENAEIKAKTYYEIFHMPVFSCDSGLYFDELKEEEQPGVHVRRINGRELSDDEMIQYYIVATHMLLEAWNIGIASCWLNLLPNDELVEAFHLPKNEKAILLMPLGYAAEDAEPIEKWHNGYKQISETVIYNNLSEF